MRLKTLILEKCAKRNNADGGDNLGLHAPFFRNFIQDREMSATSSSLSSFRISSQIAEQSPNGAQPCNRQEELSSARDIADSLVQALKNLS
jgi:hypothetical protein